MTIRRIRQCGLASPTRAGALGGIIVRESAGRAAGPATPGRGFLPLAAMLRTRCALLCVGTAIPREATNPRPGVLRVAAAQERAGPAPDPALGLARKSPERSRAGTDKETLP